MQQRPVETTVYSLAADAPPQPERRSGDRYLTLLRVGAIVADGQRELCLIRNISAGGMMIRAYSPLPVGTPVSVELKQGDPISGRVQWVEGQLTGITFQSPINVIALLAPPDDGPRPRLPRIELDCMGWVRQGGDLLRTRLVNVSQGGVRLETAAELVVGGDVVVTLPGLTPAAGVVKWRDGESYGVGFNRALVLADLVQWLQEQQLNQARKMAV